MQAAIDQFRKNIERIRNMGSMYLVMNVQTTEVLDLSDMLRSELVLAVSALDQFIHEIVRLGMLESYNNSRPQTDACLRFQVTLGSALRGIATPTSYSWLEDEIRTRHGYQSFQEPDNIADAIRLISDVQLWNEVANHLQITSQDVRQRLRLIVTRRNQIAHEADIDPSYGGRLWPIDYAMVDDSITFIDHVVFAIYMVV